MKTLTKTAARNELVVQNLQLARKLVLRRAGSLPASVDLDDLLSAAALGLIDAAAKFDGSRSIPFECYARTRIEGAILDWLRAADPLSRLDRRRHREASATEQKLRVELGREPTSSEVTARSGVELAPAVSFVELQDAAELPQDEDLPEANPFVALARSQSHGALKAAIEALPERQQLILSLYYEQDLTYREIGEIVGVTESRICQVLRQVHEKLRVTLESPQ